MHETLSRPSCPFVSFVIHNSSRNARCSSVWNRCSAWRSASSCLASPHVRSELELSSLDDEVATLFQSITDI